jgi:hypothetical protein
VVVEVMSMLAQLLPPPFLPFLHAMLPCRYLSHLLTACIACTAFSNVYVSCRQAPL